MSKQRSKIKRQAKAQPLPSQLAITDDGHFLKCLRDETCVCPTLPMESRTHGTTVTVEKRPGRNDPCHCGATDALGSVVKFKKCCGKR